MSIKFQAMILRSGRSANIGTAMLLSLVLVFAVSAQSTATVQEPAKAPANTPSPAAGTQPLTTIYKEVKIGTEAGEVKQLLGKPKIDDDDGFFFDKGSEIVQIRLDDKKKVRLISVTYSGDAANAAPSYSNIFGAEPADAKPDGPVYRLVRYPEAGYWISYSRTAGDRPSVTVTMTKL